MDKIKKIIQIGAYNGATDEWDNSDGKAYVFFEDESIAPVVLDQEDVYKAYESLAAQNGIEINDAADLADVVSSAVESGMMEFCDRENVEEFEAANAVLAAAEEIAEEKGREGATPGVVPIPVPTEGIDGIGPEEGADPAEIEDEEDYSEELEEAVVAKNNTGKRILTGVLAAAAAAGAGFTAYQMMQTEKTQDVDQDLDDDKDLDKDQTQDQSLDFNTATFDELMNSMADDDVRKVASQQAMDLVETFHEATHKDNNFRLVEDGASYLDLSFEEALILTTFANYSEPEDLHAIFGTYDITSTQAQDILESARTKMITYYMNAKEPSGLAEMFASEEDRAFFQNFESEVINFNAMHSTDTSDQIIRDVYYSYILDGATNYTNVGSMAKLLSFDAVYGGLNLTESASVEHTQFLEFHGMGDEAETRYYVENVLHISYDELSDAEKANYRENIIESGTELVSLLPSAETMTEDNSTTEEMDQNVSVTDLVDKMGLCNAVNTEITEKIQALDSMEASKEDKKSLQITTVNNSVSSALREAGLDELADKVDASLTTELSAELLSEIRAASSEAADAVENYENKMATVNDENRPSLEQIINAANKHTALLENYAGSIKDVATLINNRRHVEEYHYTADENGYIGTDESGIPIYDSSVLDDKTQEEIDEFIKENGVVIEETTEEITEEITEDQLTEEEKEQVEEQKEQIISTIEAENTFGYGQIAANSYANSSQYNFAISTVTNPYNGEVYDISSMSFANAINYITAYAENPDAYIPGVDDPQIQNAAEVAAENYLNGISADDQKTIAEGMGTSWENARAQLKESYISGYITQMEVEISTAISVGQQQKAEAAEAAAKLQEEIDALNQQQSTEETTETTEEEKESENANVAEPDSSTTETEGSTETTEEEKTEENTNTGGNGTDTTEPAPAPSEEPEMPEDEYDPNIGEQFQEGEILIEDANGNKVNQENTETEVHIEETQVAPQATTELAEDELAAAVEKAYQEALASEAAEAEVEQSTAKTR